MASVHGGSIRRSTTPRTHHHLSDGLLSLPLPVLCQLLFPRLRSAQSDRRYGLTLKDTYRCRNDGEVVGSLGVDGTVDHTETRARETPATLAYKYVSPEASECSATAMSVGWQRLSPRWSFLSFA